MAFTKNPIQSTYDTKRIPFIIAPHQRTGYSNSTDSSLVNIMVEAIEAPTAANSGVKKIVIKPRPGLTQAYSVGAGTGRGMYYWVLNGTGYNFAVVGSGVYVNGVINQTLTTSTGECGFTEYINDVGTKQLVLLDGTKGYIWSDPTIAPTAITDVNFPTPHVPQPCFMDGYLFVAKANTADVYNSNLNDPFTWTAGEFMSAEMYPDIIIGLVRNNNYINAIGTNSVEFLYDAANATGSPLGRHDGVVLQFGCAASGTIVGTEKEVIFVGATGNGGSTVWLIDGYKPTDISTPMVKTTLRAEGTNLSNAVAHCVRVSGQKLYILCLTSRTLVYSFDTSLWHEWNSGVNGETPFVGTHSSDGPSEQPYVLGKTNGIIYIMNERYGYDNGTAFQCKIVTDKLDFDSMDRKFASRLTIVGDIPIINQIIFGPTITNVYSTMTIDWSDDDYNSWSTPRTLNLIPDLPSIFQLGSFRRRAFRFLWSSSNYAAFNSPMRLEGFEIDINKGST